VTSEDLLELLKRGQRGEPPENGYGFFNRRASVGPFFVEENIEHKYHTVRQITVHVYIPMLEQFHLGKVFSTGHKVKIGDADEMAVLQDVVDFILGIDPEDFFGVGEQLLKLRAWGPEGRSSLERVTGAEDF
jgi:hypothetical protein